MTTKVNHKVVVVFSPYRLEVSFIKKLKVQIALYRNNKIDKTEPIKFTGPGTNAVIDKELKLSTTIQQANRLYQRKQVALQMACEIDGKGLLLSQKLYISDYVGKNPTTIHILTMNGDPSVLLYYRIHVMFESVPHQKKRPKVDDYDLRNQGQSQNSNKNTMIKQVYSQRATGDKLSCYPSKLSQISPTSQSNNNGHRSNRDKTVSQSKAFNSMQGTLNSQIMSRIQPSSIIKPDRSTNKRAPQKQMEQHMKKMQTKYQQLQDQNEQYTIHIKKIQNVNQQQQFQLIDLKDMIKKLQKQRQNTKCEVCKQKQKALKSLQKNYQQQLSKYRYRIDNMQKNSLVYKETEQNELANLERKIGQLEKENVKMLQAEISREHLILKLENQMQAIKEEKIEIQKAYEKQLRVIEERASKSNQFKRKLQQTQKKLLHKEEHLQRVIQKSTEKLGQYEKQKKDTISIKEKIVNDNDDLGNLQLKLQIEKLKKQLQKSRKNETIFLKQKNQLLEANKELRAQVVKSKESIAKMLNAIHEFGTENLITEVSAFIS